MENKIKVFESRQVRTAWNPDEEEWYFSVVDVVAVLTDSVDYLTGRKYWNKLKQRLSEEGSQLVTDCHRLKLQAADGKMRLTDVLNTKGVLRLIQSIPSPKAEPFKLWLAQVGSERLDEIADPEKAFTRGVEYYRKKGYPEDWITQRMLSIKIRKELTDEWQARGVTEEKEYAILTDEMTKAWSGLSVRDYKDIKGLKKESLRDNMTNMELILNMLAEATTTALSQKEQPVGMNENMDVAKRGGSFAGRTRKGYEELLGQPVVSSINAKDKSALEVSASDIQRIGRDGDT